MILELSAETTRIIEGLLATGDYGSAEQAVADGLRLLIRRTQIRQDIQQGVNELDAGQWVDGEEVFAELRRQALKITGQ